MEQEKPRILQHRHCRRCGKAFTGEGTNGRYCSKECFDLDGSEARSKLKKYAIVVVALWVVVVAAVLVVGF